MMNLDEQHFKKTTKGAGRAKSAPVDLIYGKVPPQARELEEAVLGAIMLEKGAFDKSAECLHPECFYLEAHQRIYRAMQRLVFRNEPIDILTTVESLKASQELEMVGGPYAVTKLTNAVVSSANILSHSRIIYQKYVQREVIRICGEAVATAYEDQEDAFDLVQDLERDISGLSINQSTRKFQSLGELAAQSIQVIHEAKVSGHELTGVPTGLPKLDAITQGWQLTNLILLAARPGVGKSALAGNFAMNAAINQEKPTSVAVFSLEMSARQWVDRLLSASTRIPLFDLKRGRIDDIQERRLQNAALVEYPNIGIFFDDTPSLDIHKLKSKARILVLKHKVGFIIIDYVQLLKGSRQNNDNREREVAAVSRELKQLAKELNIPIMALAQLNRQGATGEPQLGHIRESDALGQDADDVIFLYPVEESDIAQDANLKDSVLMSIAKHRNGIPERLPVKFVKGIQKLMTEEEYSGYNASLYGSYRPMNLYPTADPNKFTEPKRTDPAEDMPF